MQVVPKLRSGENWKLCSWLLLFFLTTSAVDARGQDRWSKEQAVQWQAAQPWLVGCNYIPGTAINQLEMWQAETFDPERIDQELGWAESIGFNSVRVFLHDQCWQEDRDGFLKRLDRFLEIADSHGIRAMIVIFDGVWDPDPQSGRQPRPRRGVHNSGWVQSPGRVVLADPEKSLTLKPYVQDVIRRYAHDNRVVLWDLFNEPDNENSNSYGPLELPNKDDAAARLMKLTFRWAREIQPSQPLTVGLWRGPDWSNQDELNQVHQAALELSDVISFHSYDKADRAESRIDQLERYGRPILCTEFMARGNGSTFESILPLFKKRNVAAYCWGLVEGKSQTKFPWSTWQQPILHDPEPWHHDVFHSDGKPYRQAEVQLIKSLSD